jgi:hypothetical protein
VAWITAAEVAARVGPTAPPDDPVIADQTAAAETWIKQQRAAAGWVDDVDVVPDSAVHEACLLYAVSLYRQRAAADGLPSFSEFDNTPPPTASVLPRVKALARFPRPVAV